jgi:hypothetical protein
MDDVSRITPPPGTIGTPAYIGATRAWDDCVASGDVTELGRQEFGEGKGMAWGRYNLG